MRTIKCTIYLLNILVLLSGCSPVAVLPVFYIPKDVPQEESPLVKESIKINVTLEKDGVDSYISKNNFRIALTEIIRQANLFGNEIKDYYVLNANIYKASWPSAGFTMESELCARYSLFLNNKETWNKDVCYKGEATTSESTLGAARSLLAFNRANQGHMTMLISSLKEYLNKNRDSQQFKEK